MTSNDLIHNLCSTLATLSNSQICPDLACNCSACSAVSLFHNNQIYLSSISCFILTFSEDKRGLHTRGLHRLWTIHLCKSNRLFLLSKLYISTLFLQYFIPFQWHRLCIDYYLRSDDPSLPFDQHCPPSLSLKQK